MQEQRLFEVETTESTNQPSKTGSFRFLQTPDLLEVARAIVESEDYPAHTFSYLDEEDVLRSLTLTVNALRANPEVSVHSGMKSYLVDGTEFGTGEQVSLQVDIHDETDVETLYGGLNGFLHILEPGLRDL